MTRRAASSTANSPTSNIVLSPTAAAQTAAPAPFDQLKELSEFAAIAASSIEDSSKPTSTPDAHSDNDSETVSDNTSEVKRREHNVCERRRRNNIRHGFEQLQSSIPHATMKLSKMEILRTGISHIKRLKTDIKELSVEIEELRRMKMARAKKAL